MARIQLADRTRVARPDLEVLFTSGYAPDAVVHDGVLEPGAHLIGEHHA